MRIDKLGIDPARLAETYQSDGSYGRVGAYQGKSRADYSKSLKQNKIDTMAKNSDMDPEQVAAEIEDSGTTVKNVQASDSDTQQNSAPKPKFQKKITSGSPTIGKGSQEPVEESTDVWSMLDLDKKQLESFTTYDKIIALESYLRRQDGIYEAVSDSSDFQKFMSAQQSAEPQPGKKYVILGLSEVVLSSRSHLIVTVSPQVIQVDDLLYEGRVLATTSQGIQDTFPPPGGIGDIIEKSKNFILYFDNLSDYDLFRSQFKIKFPQQVDLPEITQRLDASQFHNPRVKSLRKRARRLRKLIRASRFDSYNSAGGAQQLMEVDFNNAQVVKSALSKPIQCGFELECLWPGESQQDEDWLEDLDWYEVRDLIYDQHGQRIVDRLDQAFYDWMFESDNYYEIEEEILKDLVDDLREREDYLDDFIQDEIPESDVEEYRDERMAHYQDKAQEAEESGDQQDLMVYQTEIQERSDWDMDAWAREYVEMYPQVEEEYLSWLKDKIRDEGDHTDDVVTRFQSRYDMKDFAHSEYGSWQELLDDYDAMVYNEDAVGLSEIENVLETWTENYSKTGRIDTGSYGDGQSVDNEYWRLEDDSSIEGQGIGAEIISPRYDNVVEMLREARSLFRFLNENNVATNSTTGFHVTMSWGGEKTQIDGLKMVMLMGDPYVLQQFEREFNSYTESQKKAVMTAARNYIDNPSETNFQTMETILYQGLRTHKYSSIHFKGSTNSLGNDIVEFRAAGGGGYLESFEKIANTVARYAVTMQAGHEPDAFRKDYQKAVVKTVMKATDLESSLGTAEYIPPENRPDKNVLMTFRKMSVSDHWSGIRANVLSAYETDNAKNMLAALSLCAMIVARGKNQGKIGVNEVRTVRSVMKKFGITAQQVVDAGYSQANNYLFKNELGQAIQSLPAAVAKMIGKRDAIDFSPGVNKQHIKIPSGSMLLVHNEVIEDINTGYGINIDPDDLRIVSKEDYKLVKQAAKDTSAQGIQDRRDLVYKYMEKYELTPGNYNRYVPATTPVMAELRDQGYYIEDDTLFDSLDLSKKIKLAESLDKARIDAAWRRLVLERRKPKPRTRLSESGNRASDYIQALEQKFGGRYRNILRSSLQEQALPDVNSVEILNRVLAAPIRGDDLDTQMEAFAALPVPAMIDDFRDMRSTHGDRVDLRVVVNKYLERLHPGIREKIRVGGRRPSGLSEAIALAESRGVTARVPGETYVNVNDPDDVLTLRDITVLPQDQEAYQSLEELQQNLDAVMPDNGAVVEDNKPNSGTKAAIVATVTDVEGNPQYWVRYLRAIPPSGVGGLWKTLRGYKYSKGAKQESLPVKPTDVVTPDVFQTTEQLAASVIENINKSLAGTPHETMIPIMTQAVENARANDPTPIPGAVEYQDVLIKYGGEYLGPLALIDGGNTQGDTQQMLDAYELTTLAGSQVMFPGDTAYELVDSIIRTPDGQEIGVSSKAHKGGGAASSLSGIVKQLTPELEAQYPKAALIIRTLGEESAIDGPLRVAQMLRIISKADVQALTALGKTSTRVADLKSQKIKELMSQQGVADRKDPNYRVIFHALTAIVNTIIPKINARQDFVDLMKATLNNNNFIQLMTAGRKSGDAIGLEYYTKYPAVFEGSPQLYNKSYFATGQKGRLGFKLKK